MPYDKIDIDTRTYDFALQILSVVDAMPSSHGGTVLARQFARSGTSIGANVEESRAAESTSDFIHKMGIALKEARETHYWLRIIREKKMVTMDNLLRIVQEADEIKKILGASVRTAKQRKK